LVAHLHGEARDDPDVTWPSREVASTGRLAPAVRGKARVQAHELVVREAAAHPADIRPAARVVARQMQGAEPHLAAFGHCPADNPKIPGLLDTDLPPIG